MPESYHYTCVTTSSHYDMIKLMNYYTIILYYYIITLHYCIIILVDPLPGVETNSSLVTWLTGLSVDCVAGQMVDWLTGYLIDLRTS